LKCKSIIEIEKELRKGKQEKKEHFVPVGVTNRDKMSLFFIFFFSQFFFYFNYTFAFQLNLCALAT